MAAVLNQYLTLIMKGSGNNKSSLKDVSYVPCQLLSIRSKPRENYILPLGSVDLYCFLFIVGPLYV